MSVERKFGDEVKDIHLHSLSLGVLGVSDRVSNNVLEAGVREVLTFEIVG